ncbi:uncharacterized protein LOC126681907 [Mercurialis annua]|uniref:uncharacterized protein LOC126681907 n=1 Tax=Mercurialis annua TaxID=3986 RepID=UPI00215F9C33|nr:uncharacterized protein LOC126681907 [Mercurialis annua]
MADYTIFAQKYVDLSRPGLPLKKEHLISWCRPPPSWLKINFDGAVHSPSNKASSGGLARYNDGDWIFGIADALGVARKIILEMDSKLVVDALNQDDRRVNANT